MARIAVLHPGAMGTQLGAALVAAGHDVGWLPAGRSAATARRADTAGLARWADLEGVELVVSVCPPAAALDVARSVVQSSAGFGGRYLDANAISPATAAQVAEIVSAAGATYVDGGIIGPPPVHAGTTRLYLSGTGAEQVAALFTGSPLDARVVAGQRFAASALKMAYASWTKGTAALLLAIEATAAHYGIDAALRDEWSISQPELADRLAAAQRSATTKGWRWEDELRQVAATFAEAGEPAGFGEAAAQVFGRYPRP